MDIVQQWSERIARRVAPAETAFASDAGMAYAAGGRRREDLLPHDGVQPGGFGPATLVAELPRILQALDYAGSALIVVLRSQYLGNALAAGSLLVAVRQDHSDRLVPRSREPARAQKSPEPPAGAPAPPTTERQAIGYSFDRLSERLESAGFTRRRAGQLAYELLDELLDDAAGAAAFLDALSSADGGEEHAGARAGGRRFRWLCKSRW